MSGKRNYTPGRARRRCKACGVTETSCMSLARDTGRPCCPECQHETKEED